MRGLGMRSGVGIVALAVVGWLNATLVGAQTKEEPTQLALAPEVTRNVAVGTDVLSAVPSDALYLAMASNVAELKETIESVLKKLNVPLENEQYKKLNDFVEGLQGWDKKRMHAFALLPGEDGDMEMAFFVPVTDYKKFAKSVGADPAVNGPAEFSIDGGPDGLIVEKGNVAVLVERGQEDLLKRILAANASVTPALAPVQAFLSKQQIGGVMLPAGLKKGLKDALQGLDAVSVLAPDNAGANNIFGDVLKMVRDEVTMLAAGVRIDESKGIDLAVQGVLKSGGNISAAAKNVAPLPPQPLKGLADEDFIVAGAGVIPTGATKAMTEFSLKLLANLPKEAGGYDLTPEQLKELVEASLHLMDGVKHMSMSMGVADQSLYGRTSSFFATEDAPKFLEGYEKATKKLAEIAAKNPESTYPSQEVKRRKIDGRDVLIVTTDISKMLEKKVGEAPQIKGMMETMFGKDGKLSAYLTAVDQNTVAMAYDEEMLKQAVAAVKEGQAGLAANEQLLKTAAMLPAGSQWIGFVSVGGYVEMVKKMMNAMLGGVGAVPGGFPFQIPPFPASAPIGISAQLAPTAIEGHVVVPMSLMESIRDFAQQMQVQIGGGLR